MQRRSLASLAATLALAACAAQPGSGGSNAAPSRDAFAAAEAEARSARSRPSAASLRAWPIRAGDTLRANIERWATTEGYRLSWEAGFDYPVRYDAEISAPDLRSALEQVIESTRGARIPLRYLMVEGNRVVRIVTW